MLRNVRGLTNNSNNSVPLEIILLFLLVDGFEAYMNYKIFKERNDSYEKRDVKN
jgi:hypothetical protein